MAFTEKCQELFRLRVAGGAGEEQLRQLSYTETQESYPTVVFPQIFIS